MKLFVGLFLTAFLWACGSEKEEAETPAAPAPTKPIVTPPETSDGFKEIALIMEKSCERCHSGAEFLTDEEAFVESGAAGRVARNNMPLGGSAEARGLSASDRNKIANFK